jgi:hypothetical protein
MQKNPVTVNNGYFTVCQNSFAAGAHTNHCTRNLTEIAGTGYEDIDPLDPEHVPIGGATGWLSTNAPVSPGEMITLRFIVFDEGDAILDSAVLIDSFVWGTQTLTQPSTTVIQ